MPRGEPRLDYLIDYHQRGFERAGAAFIAIGLRLRAGNIRVAYWARIAILWLGMGLVAYITLPLLRPAIAIALIFRTLDALRVFDLYYVLFGRRQLSMATYNFETLVSNQQDGYASAISVIIFIFISVFAFIYVRLLNVEA